MKRLLAVSFLLALCVPAPVRAADEPAAPAATVEQNSADGGASIGQGEGFFCVDVICALSCIIRGNLSGGFCSNEICYCVGDSGGPAPILSSAPDLTAVASAAPMVGTVTGDGALECLALSAPVSRVPAAAVTD